MKNLKTIYFNFENTEQGKLPAKAVKSLTIDDICTKRSRSLSNNYNNHPVCECDDYLYAKSFAIELDYEAANKQEKTYNGLLGQRLYKIPDIVDVILQYTDGSKEDIYLPWSGDDNNLLQYCHLSINKPVSKHKIEYSDKLVNRKILSIYVAE